MQRKHKAVAEKKGGVSPNRSPPSVASGGYGAPGSTPGAGARQGQRGRRTRAARAAQKTTMEPENDHGTAQHRRRSIDATAGATDPTKRRQSGRGHAPPRPDGASSESPHGWRGGEGGWVGETRQRRTWAATLVHCRIISAQQNGERSEPADYLLCAQLERWDVCLTRA